MTIVSAVQSQLNLISKVTSFLITATHDYEAHIEVAVKLRRTPYLVVKRCFIEKWRAGVT